MGIFRDGGYTAIARKVGGIAADILCFSDQFVDGLHGFPTFALRLRDRTQTLLA